MVPVAIPAQSSPMFNVCWLWCARKQSTSFESSLSTIQVTYLIRFEGASGLASPSLWEESSSRFSPFRHFHCTSCSRTLFVSSVSDVASLADLSTANPSEQPRLPPPPWWPRLLLPPPPRPPLRPPPRRPRPRRPRPRDGAASGSEVDTLLPSDSVILSHQKTVSKHKLQGAPCLISITEFATVFSLSRSGQVETQLQ